jgi:hypothetical protein
MLKTNGGCAKFGENKPVPKDTNNKIMNEWRNHHGNN